MTTFEWGVCLFIVPFLIPMLYETIRERRCAVCRKVVWRGAPKVLDSYHHLQYLCSGECLDNYRGWYCVVCQYLHDNDTTMEGYNSCIE